METFHDFDCRGESLGAALLKCLWFHFEGKEYLQKGTYLKQTITFVYSTVYTCIVVQPTVNIVCKEAKTDNNTYEVIHLIVNSRGSNSTWL